MPSLAFLLVGNPELSHVAKALRAAFPNAVLNYCEDPDHALAQAGPHDVVIVRAENNAGFTRVRHLRRAYPTIGIIVTAAERDRSGDAYVAGANEFALAHDDWKLVQAVQDVLTYTGQNAPGARRRALLPPRRLPCPSRPAPWRRPRPPARKPR
jgi:hypothetical protein